MGWMPEDEEIDERGVALVNGTVVKSWSSTQATIAQSSGEAEYYSVARAAAEGLGIQALMADMGFDAEVEVHVDSSSAKSISSRIGLGKLRHMEVKFLWIQEVVRTKRIRMKKVRGDSNPADILTKPQSLKSMKSNNKLTCMGVVIAVEAKLPRRSWADITEEEQRHLME